MKEKTQKIIKEGQRKGHLTYDEINEMLPEEMVSAKQIDNLLSTLGKLDIEIVPSIKEFHARKQAGIKRTELDIEKAKIYDPIRAYLHQMGRISLLTRKEEKELAKTIEEGNKNIEEILENLIPGKIFQLKSKKKNMTTIVSELKEILEGEKEGLFPEDELEIGWGIDKEELLKCMPVIEKEAEEVTKAKRKMVECNLRLVVSIAKKYIYRGLPLLDLIQEGNIGLMRAVDKFEYKRGYKFSTYATWWIRQAITRAIADQARTIRIPVHMIETINKLVRTSQQFVQKSGREPTAEELAKKMKLPSEKVRGVIKISKHPISLETPVGSDEDSHFGDFLEDREASMPHDTAAFAMLKEQISKVLETLPEREKEILRLRFGIGGIPSHTLEEVGRKFNVTRERVRQIEAKALKKLRDPARSKSLQGHLE